jgi:hypothetical protein
MKIATIEVTKSGASYAVTVADDTMFGKSTHRIDVTPSKGPRVWSDVAGHYTVAHSVPEHALAAVATRFAEDVAAIEAAEKRAADILAMAEELEALRQKAEKASWAGAPDESKLVSAHRSKLAEYTAMAARWFAPGDHTPYPTERAALDAAYDALGKQYDGNVVRVRVEWEGPVPGQLQLRGGAQ